jgi:lipopolysaccharide heptosyltransferase II
VRRILVRSTNWIGDVVMISPALRSLREGYPDAQLDVVARASVSGAFRDHPLVDEVIVEQRRSGDRRHEGLGGAFRLAAELRSRRYDLAVLLPKSFGAAVAPSLARIPRRVGYATDRRRLLLTHPVPLPVGVEGLHHAEFFLGPALYLGCPDLDRSLVFPVSRTDREAAAERLREVGSARLVAIHPGASRPERAWSAGRFGELAAALSQDGFRVVVLGAEQDRDAARVVLAAAGGTALDAVGLGGLGTMAALVERCELFVGNDSGPMHVAAAMGTPTVSLFGPGVPERTAPYVSRDRRREITDRFPCAPCRQDFFRECRPAASGKPWCLESIEVAPVLDAARELLNGE